MKNHQRKNVTGLNQKWLKNKRRRLIKIKKAEHLALENQIKLFSLLENDTNVTNVFISFINTFKIKD